MRTRNQSGTVKSNGRQQRDQKSVEKTRSSKNPRNVKRQKTITKALSRGQRLQARARKVRDAAQTQNQGIKEERSAQAGNSVGSKRAVAQGTVDQAAPKVAPDQATATPHDLFTSFKHPTAYSSNIHEFLRQNEAVSRHKRRIQKFDRRKTQINGPYCAIQVDTM
jgi:hypothetical protein